LAKNVAEAPPQRPKPQTQDELLGLFSADTVGRHVVLEPASSADMLGHETVAKRSFEVVYDEV
jgi:chlorophyllide a reductase subunit X